MENEPGTDPATTTFNILFVCTGNTCRSPMAEALARAEVERRGWHHVQVGSAGIAAAPGAGASTEAQAVTRERGLDLSGHRSRPLSPELVEWADLILAMGSTHLVPVARLGGEDKMALLADFATGEDRSRGVLDPFGGSVLEYEETFRDLAALVSGALDRLAPILHP